MSKRSRKKTRRVTALLRKRKSDAFDFDDVCADIESMSKETSIYVGCDSQEIGRGYTRFVTVVVLHIDSCRGGKCHFECIKEYRMMPLKERLLKEVDRSIQAALAIVESVGDRNFEVHLDINTDPKHASNKVLDIAKGYVTAQGLTVKVKPDSFAATAIADYFVRHSAA